MWLPLGLSQTETKMAIRRKADPNEEKSSVSRSEASILRSHLPVK
jgi:hypothetical protein